MSKRGFLRGSCAAAALGIAAVVGAQERGELEPTGPGIGAGFAGGIEARWLERHAKELGLDEKTLEEVRKIAEETRSSANRRSEELRNESRRLGEKLAEEMPDAAALAKQAEAMGRVWTAALKDRVNASVRMRKLLTPEQRKKAAELRRKEPPGRRAARP
jgi:Spy/CpxP family protein refolding chaperone